MSDTGDLILFQSEDGQARIEARLVGESVWLSAGQMAELFQRDKSVISRHIQNVYEEGELLDVGTVAKFATVQKEGDREVSREIEFYNLDVIISVGYRVKSHRGTQFRIWATRQLREFLVKGFLLNDEKFKQGKNRDFRWWNPTQRKTTHLDCTEHPIHLIYTLVMPITSTIKAT